MQVSSATETRVTVPFNNLQTLLNQQLFFWLPSIILADVSVSENKSLLQWVQKVVHGLWLVDLHPFFYFFFRVLLVVIVIMIDGSEKCNRWVMNFKVRVLLKGAINTDTADSDFFNPVSTLFTVRLPQPRPPDKILCKLANKNLGC